MTEIQGAVSKVEFLILELTNCNYNVGLPLQTSPNGATLKSPSGDLGGLALSLLTNYKQLKT